jgi:hypothetical protein
VPVKKFIKFELLHQLDGQPRPAKGTTVFDPNGIGIDANPLRRDRLVFEVKVCKVRAAWEKLLGSVRLRQTANCLLDAKASSLIQRS